MTRPTNRDRAADVLARILAAAEAIVAEGRRPTLHAIEVRARCSNASIWRHRKALDPYVPPRCDRSY